LPKNKELLLLERSEEDKKSRKDLEEKIVAEIVKRHSNFEEMKQ